MRRNDRIMPFSIVIQILIGIVLGYNTFVLNSLEQRIEKNTERIFNLKNKNITNQIERY